MDRFKSAIIFVLLVSLLIVNTYAAGPNDPQKLQDRYIRKWRQLTSGMTEAEVRRLLGSPKLIQCGSRECFWFYQDLPKSHYRITDDVNEVIFSVGRIHSGIIIFKNKVGIETIYEREQKRLESDISVADEQQRKALDRNEKMRELNRDVMRRNTIWRGDDEKTRKSKVRIIDKREIRDYTDEVIKDTHETTIKEAEMAYKRRIKNAKQQDVTIEPVYSLSRFRPPDWNKIDLLADKPPDEDPNIPSLEKWQKPSIWRKQLKFNLPKNKVYVLLGRPCREEKGLAGTTAFYGVGPGQATVRFTAREDLQEYLSGWEEPFWPTIQSQPPCEAAENLQTKNLSEQKNLPLTSAPADR